MRDEKLEKYKKIVVPDNYQGVKIGAEKSDWLAGINSPIDNVVLVDDGKWEQYSSRHEVQVYSIGYSDSYDTSLCTSYSGTDAIEHLLNRLIDDMPYDTYKFFNDNGYIVNGKFEISDRLSGANSDMTVHGTYLWKMANAIRDFGIVPQSLLPLADNFSDNIDPAKIPQNVYDLGKESLKYITINWNWVERSQVSEYLKYAPLVATVKYADGDGILKPEGNHNHAILVPSEDINIYNIDDSYWRQYKKYQKDYVDNFLQFKITFNNNNMIDLDKFFKDNDLKWVQNSNTGQFGRIMQNKLAVINSNDRGALILLDDKMRNEPSIKLTNGEWEQLPKKDF